MEFSIAIVSLPSSFQTDAALFILWIFTNDLILPLLSLKQSKFDEECEKKNTYLSV